MAIADRRQRERERRERDILDAALALAQTEDWLMVTVDQIAARAEIGKGTVYKHFVSKDEISGWLMLDFHRLVLRDLRQIDPVLSVPARVRAVIRVYWYAHLNYRQYQRILEYTVRDSFRRSLPPRLMAAWEALAAETNPILFGVIEEGVREGLFPDRPVGELMMGPQAVVNGMVLMLWGGCADTGQGDRFLDELTRFVLAGLAAGHTHASSAA